MSNTELKIIFLEQGTVQTRLPDKNCPHDRYKRRVKILKLRRHASPAALILPPRCMHTHTHTHPGEILSPLWSRGDLYRAEKQVGWHFAALEPGGGFERKYIQLCLWNVLVRIWKDSELFPPLCSCRTPVAVTRAFLFIWQHAASVSRGHTAAYATASSASNKWAWLIHSAPCWALMKM